MNTLSGGQKYIQTMINKHGSREAWLAYAKEISAKGGSAKTKTPKGFAAMTPEQRKLAGQKGGKKSRIK